MLYLYLLFFHILSVAFGARQIHKFSYYFKGYLYILFLHILTRLPRSRRWHFCFFSWWPDWNQAFEMIGEIIIPDLSPYYFVGLGTGFCCTGILAGLFFYYFLRPLIF